MSTYEEIAGKIHGVYHKIRIASDGEFLPDTIENIEYINTVNDSTGFEVGTTYSSQISFSIENPSKDIRGLEIYIEDGVRDSDGSFQYAPIGYFLVDTAISDRGIVTHTCYDRMSYVFSGTYETSLTFPTTDKAIIEEICKKCGVSFSGNLVSHKVEEKPSGTYKSVLGYMLQLQGKNAFFNADGNLEIKWYEDSDYTIDDSRIYFDGDASTAEKFTFGYVKNVRSVKKTETRYEEQTTYDDDGNEHTSQVPYTEEVSEEQTYTAGDGVQGITFTNPYMTQEIVNELFSKLDGFSYTPATLNAVGDFRLRVMSVISVITDNGEVYKVPVMSVTHSCDGGLSDVISAYGQSGASNEISGSSAQSMSFSRYDAEIAYLKSVYANMLNAERAKIIYLETKELKSEVAKFGYLYADFANITEASIKKLFLDTGIVRDLTVTEDLKVTGTLSGIKITGDVIEANTISARSIILKDQGEDGLIYQINVTASGLSAEELTNDKYKEKLSGTDIVAKSVTAEQISVKDLQAISAKIGGWDLGDGYIRDRDAQGKCSGIGREGVTFAFFAGGNEDDGSDAPFRVNHSGELFATGATITGDVEAISLDVQEVIQTEYISVDGAPGKHNVNYVKTISSVTGPVSASPDGYMYVGIMGDSDGFSGDGLINLGGIYFELKNSRGDIGAKQVEVNIYSSSKVNIEAEDGVTITGGLSVDGTSFSTLKSAVNANSNTIKSHTNSISSLNSNALKITGGTINNNAALYAKASGGTQLGVVFCNTSNNMHFCWTMYDSGIGNTYYSGNTVYMRAQTHLYRNKSWEATSDERLKHDIKSVPDAFLEAYMDIEPVQYIWNDSPDSGKQSGVIAQQVSKVLKDHGIEADEANVVTLSEDTETYGFRAYTVNYDFLNIWTMAVVQKQEKRIKELVAEIEKIKEKI